MLLTITTTKNPATDLGYLLHKHPDRMQAFDLAFGKAHVFYPESTPERTTIGLLLDMDPVALVRGVRKRGDAPLSQYVNDKPYICSSFMSTAIAQVFGSALNGKCANRPELVAEEWPFSVSLYSLPVRGGPSFLGELFEPLGYAVANERLALDPEFPEWGDSAYYNVTFEKTTRLRELLAQLYVLIPVLDRDKHYWVSDHEVEKLMQKGGDWLANHPSKDTIVKRYLKFQKRLTRIALSNLVDDDPPEAIEERSDPTQEDNLEKPIKLVAHRMQFIEETLDRFGSSSVIDFGCGEGRLLKRLFKKKAIGKLTGVDVSPQALERAVSRLRLENLPVSMTSKLNLVHGSVLYHDERFAGYDAGCLIEVIEHIEADRLHAVAQNIFGMAKPKVVIVTTPNKEYNQLFENLPDGKLRHSDHRFEWTRAEFARWAGDVATTYGYDYVIEGIGSTDENLGEPTQAAVFTQLEQ